MPRHSTNTKRSEGISPDKTEDHMHIRNYDRVLWDFNGTLLDDVALGISATNQLLGQRGLPAIPSEEAYRAAFGFPVKNYYRAIGLPYEGEAFAEIAEAWMALYRAGEHTAPLREGCVSVLNAIRDAGVAQGVLSAMENRMLEERVTALGIRPYFDHLFGLGDIYAADKTDLAKRYALTHAGERVLMIGDTDHDAETAAAGGFDCALIEGGHQTRERLLSTGCRVFADFDAFSAWLSEE